jgi:sirohydrochlorin cobaltochelatase
MASEFSDAALLLIGHGSTLNGDSALPTYKHAAEIRERKVFAQVLEAFWKEHPTIAGALRGAYSQRVFVVPLFISDGYFTEQVIPRELGLCRNGQTDFPRIQERDGKIIHYCGPVGTHAAMTPVILERARQVVASGKSDIPPSPSETSLFIAGHGTGNNENSRKAIERQVELIREQGQFHDVHAIFMEEEPLIASCYTSAETDNVIVVPFFISDGLHSFEDIPVMLGEAEHEVQSRLRQGKDTFPNPTERNGKRVWYSRSIGNEPLLAEVILERAREMTALKG